MMYAINVALLFSSLQLLIKKSLQPGCVHTAPAADEGVVAGYLLIFYILFYLVMLLLC